MTDNPLKSVETTRQKRTAQEWCDIGNARLDGSEPYAGKKFQGYAPRADIRWIVENGQPALKLMTRFDGTRP